MNKPILSISILVSNRIDTVEKTMKSVKMIMDRVPSELIVVDTVGEEKSDGSLAIAKQYATKLVHFDWINDFAAARNAGLKEATGEWFMFLDDDEEFIEIDDLVNFFSTGEYKKYSCATYKLHDHTDNVGHYVEEDMQRMLKLQPETTFKGRIHEYISPMRPPVKELKSYADHHGYVFETIEDKMKKFNRNWPLLQEEYKENPHDVRIRLHLVQACIDTEGYVEKADEICKDTIFNGKSWISSSDRMMPFYQWILSAYVRIATKTDDHEEIIKRVDEMRKEPYLSNLLRLALAVMDISSAKALKLSDRVADDLETVCEEYRFLNDNPGKLFFQKELDLGMFMEKELLCSVLGKGISYVRETGLSTGNTKANLFNKAFRLYKTFKNKPYLTVLIRLPYDVAEAEKTLLSVKTLSERLEVRVIAVSSEPDDNVTRVAEKYSAKIIRCDRVYDHSEMANVGLKDIDSEWLLYLEDGSWIDNANEIVEFFESAEYLEYSSACLHTKDYKGNGKEYSESYTPCMVRIFDSTCFENVVKEELRPFNKPCKFFNSGISRAGIVFDENGCEIGREERDYKLLEREHNAHPDRLEVRVQFADETAKRDAEKGLILVKATLSRFVGQKDNPFYQYITSVYFRLCESLGIGVDEAAKEYDHLKSKGMLKEHALCAASYVMTRLCLINDCGASATGFVNDYFANYDIINKQKESEKERVKGDLGFFAEEDVYREMLLFGSNIYAGAGMVEDAWELIEKLPWDDNRYASGADALGIMFYVNSMDEKPEFLFDIIKKVMKNPAIKPAFSVLLQSRPDVKRTVDRCLSFMGGRT